MGQFLRHTSPSLSTFQPYRLAAQGFLELDHGTDLGSLLPWGGGGLGCRETWALQILRSLTFNPMQKHELGAHLSKPFGP